MLTAIPPNLHWAVRRGMLELDILLSHFLNERFLQLNEATQQQFIDLLTTNDQDLYMWLTAKSAPNDDATRAIVQMIRQHAKDRHA